LSCTVIAIDWKFANRGNTKKVRFGRVHHATSSMN
jgi:hypothetical protein